MHTVKFSFPDQPPLTHAVPHCCLTPTPISRVHAVHPELDVCQQVGDHRIDAHPRHCVHTHRGHPGQGEELPVGEVSH